jgi:hypothetical protein
MPKQEGEQLREDAGSSGWFKPATTWLAIILLARLLAAGAYREAVASGGLFGIDFEQYHSAAENVRRGRPVYSGPLYPYTPLVAIVMRPFASLPLDRAVRVWAATCVVMLAGAVALCAWANRVHPVRDAAVLVLMMLTAFRFWPTVIELAVGNVDMVLFLLLAGVYVSESRDRPVASAILIALGGLTKTWFVGLVVYLVLRRAWRAAGIAVAAYALGLAAMFAALGWWQFPQFVAKTRAYSWQPNIIAMSVPGMARLYLCENPLVTPVVNTPRVAALLAVAGVCSLGVALLWAGRRLGGRPGDRGVLLGLTVVTMLLAMPVSHLPYYVLALPAIWTLLVTRRDAWAFGLATIAYVTLSLPSPFIAPIREANRFFPGSLWIGTPFVAGVLLWLGLMWPATRRV